MVNDDRNNGYNRSIMIKQWVIMVNHDHYG
jgi:hypothetical protein